MPCALHPSAVDWHGAGEGFPTSLCDGGWGDSSAASEGTVSSGSPRGKRASVFDIVTVEGEGCSAAGWEGMSRGGTRGGWQMVCREITSGDRSFSLGFGAVLKI